MEQTRRRIGTWPRATAVLPLVLTFMVSAVRPAMASDGALEREQLAALARQIELADRLAEAFAERMHQRVRTELWGYQPEEHLDNEALIGEKYVGIRPAPGYPACPDMSDQDKLFRLLKPDRIGCVLTENWQIDPEQSTSAIIVHHPEAKYFNT